MSAREDIEAEIKALEETYAEFYRLWTDTRVCINRLRSVCPMDPAVKPMDSLLGVEIDQAKAATIVADVKKQHESLKEKLNAIKSKQK